MTLGNSGHQTVRGNVTKQGALRTTAQQSSRSFATQETSVPEEADVVIIGGGSIGTSTLYHLQKLGVNAVLVEGNELTSGTTWHSAGLLWQLAGMAGQMDTDIESIQYTKKLVSEVLPEETDDWAGWVNTGAIFACSSRERQISHNRVRLLAQAMYGIEAFDLTPDEAKDVHPLMRTDDLFGAVYVPGDGSVDPSALVRAYAKGAKQRGAKIFEKTRVTEILQEKGRVIGVKTNKGDIRTNKVVNCGGAWARKIADMAGVKCPLLAYKHAYVVTEEIEGLKGLPSIRDYDRSVYMKVSGGAFHIGGYEKNPIRIQTDDGWDMEDDFSFGLYDLDYDVFMCHLEAHINRVPAIEEAGIQSTCCGPESFTSDHRPLMGETPELQGFFLGCGLNSAGIMYSGGFGRELASWVATGRAKTDVFGFDVRRFHPDCAKSDNWLEERSHETYANQSIIPWSYDQPLGGRNVIKSHFHDDLVDRGCALIESHGYERPGWFPGAKTGETFGVLPYDFMGAYEDRATKHESDPYEKVIVDRLCNYHIHKDWESEHVACREAVAVFDTSAFGKLRVTGSDAPAAMEWLCSNKVAAPGATMYTTLCNAEGTVEADLTVSTLEGGDSFYMCTAGATKTRDLAHIRSVFRDANFDAVVEDVTQDVGILSIQGPRSRWVLEQLSDVDFGNDAFPFSTHQEIAVAGHDGVRAIRITFMGELGFELHVPRAACQDVYRSVMAAGESAGIRDAGYFATSSLSLEKGYRHWNQDLRCTDTPMQAGLGFTCKFKTDTPFLGRDALEAIRAMPHKGLNGRVACFTAGHVGEGESEVPLHGMEPIYRDGVWVGFLRTAGYGFSIESSIGYGWVHPPDGVDGQKTTSLKYLREGNYEIDSYEHGRVPAKYHAKAPFDPKGDRIKGIYDGDEPLVACE
eukprot:g1494.t1